MKFQKNKIALFLCVLCFFLNARQSFAQKISYNLDLNYILSKLAETSCSGKSAKQLNTELIEAIREHKVNFLLGTGIDELIKNAGGNEYLISAIRENLQEDLGEKLDYSKKTYSRIELEENHNLYKLYVDNYRGNLEQRKIAIAAVKQYVEKYGDDENFRSQIEYLKGANFRESNFDPISHVRQNCYGKFNQAFTSESWNELFDVGAEILKREPEFVDVSLALASVGFETKNHKYLDHTLRFAEMSIELLEKGKSSSKRFGVFKFEYATQKFPDGKSNALGWMNYIIGFLKYFHLNQKTEAIVYFEKSLQYESESRELIRRLNLPEAKDLLHSSN